MNRPRSLAAFALIAAFLAKTPAFAADPALPGVGPAMEEMVAKDEIAGAVTVVVTKKKVIHLECTGYADAASKRAMTPDTLFWIASMTKPVTAVAVLMLQDEGKLKVSDPVAKYLPEFAGLKTPSGKPANLTISQILTHTSGLGEATGPAARQAKTLADLVPIWLAAPMQYEPSAKWQYTQSGINAAARIVEVVGGMSFGAFLQKRLFDPLEIQLSIQMSGNTPNWPPPTARIRTPACSNLCRLARTLALEATLLWATADFTPQGRTTRDSVKFC